MLLLHRILYECGIKLFGSLLFIAVYMIFLGTGHDNSNNSGAYLATALKAGVKLAAEDRNIREYINAKFEQMPSPGIMLFGDANDGPDNDYFDFRYLFFERIKNLQGEDLLAQRFFNHPLFDFTAHLCRTAKYGDEIAGIPASQNPLLLDHILMSQPLCNGSLPLIVNAGKKGKVTRRLNTFIIPFI